MKTVHCQTCNKPIPFNKSKGIKNYLQRKYCSPVCSHRGIPRKEPTPHPERMKKCIICRQVIPKEKNRNWNMYAKKKYCSLPCSAKAQTQKITLPCTHCGKNVTRSPSHIRGDVYCNRKCRTSHYTVEYECPICNKKGKKPRAMVENNEFIYCSKACADIGLKCEMIAVKCDYCDKIFERYPSEIEKAAQKGYKFTFCNHSCRAAMIANQFKVPVPFTGIHKGQRNFVKLDAWRAAVKKRDDFTCQDCGVTDTMVVAHHIKPFALYPKLRYIVSNGLTLCYPCHTKRHSDH